MASATNSRARDPLDLQRFAAELAPVATRASAALLVIRCPRRAQARVFAAFAKTAAAMLRAGDLTAHDPAAGTFFIALSAPSRSAGGGAPDCRAILERVAAAVALHAGAPLETGWQYMRGAYACRDLRRAAEIALERGARERERYEFFAAVGHELRTPLTSIRGYLETLIDGSVDHATARRFLETARRETLRMGRLLEGMFRFSLLDLSVQSVPERSCEVAHAVASACEVVAPLAGGRGIRIEQGPVARIRAGMEADALVQLLVNLLENAVKYGREGGCVRIGVQVRAGCALLRVDDDGPGVALAERESIFQLRARGEGAAASPGSGIGLAIVKMIAERSGGAIRAGDSPMGGARFEATLPLGADFPASAS